MRLVLCSSKERHNLYVSLSIRPSRYRQFSLVCSGLFERVCCVRFKSGLGLGANKQLGLGVDKQLDAYDVDTGICLHGGHLGVFDQPPRIGSYLRITMLHILPLSAVLIIRLCCSLSFLIVIYCLEDCINLLLLGFERGYVVFFWIRSSNSL